MNGRKAFCFAVAAAVIGLGTLPVQAEQPTASPPASALSGTAQPEAGKDPYHHLLILGDPHLPGKHIGAKERILREIGSWDDLEGVIALGDLCADRGTEEEYAAVKDFFGKLGKPLQPVAGNHDVLYEDLPDPKGKRVRANPETIERKLRRFRETFGLPAIHDARMVGPYLLVFLSTDRWGSLAGISETQFEWLRKTLDEHPRTPTLIFFHAPLRGTLRDYNGYANTFNFIAQPAEGIHDLLQVHPQVFLWVSGHMHTTPEEESFASPINLYDNRVTNVHAPDMNRKTIWTLSLFLHPDRVIVRTYNHKAGIWLKDVERIIPAPQNRRGSEINH
jgi:3',5'-cyclic-AMP phosphodiesterase